MESVCSKVLPSYPRRRASRPYERAALVAELLRKFGIAPPGAPDQVLHFTITNGYYVTIYYYKKGLENRAARRRGASQGVARRRLAGLITSVRDEALRLAQALFKAGGHAAEPQRTAMLFSRPAAPSAT